MSRVYTADVASMASTVCISGSACLSQHHPRRVQLLGVRQKILQRSHVDGYRLARLSAAQLRGYPFSALEQWRLHLLRLSHVVFRVLSAGSAVGGACPISALCGALRHKFGCAAPPRLLAPCGATPAAIRACVAQQRARSVGAATSPSQPVSPSPSSQGRPPSKQW